MKKLISGLSAALMIAAMSVTAIAGEEVVSEVGDTDQHNNDIETFAVYSVDVNWGAMEFTYSATGTMTWNPATHTYSESIQKSWTASGNTVTVTNRSDAEVGIGFSYESEESYSGITGEFDVTSHSLAAVDGSNPDNADSITATLTLSGELSEDIAVPTKLGTATVTIRAVKEIPLNSAITDVTGSLKAEEGMTWGEWINSIYNTAGFTVSGDGYVSLEANVLCTEDAINRSITADEAISFEDIVYSMHN